MTILVAKIGAALLALTLIITALIAMQVQDLVVGSVTVGNEYNATTTGDFVSGGGTEFLGVLKSKGGAIGSVVLTGTAAGSITFFNATTSDVGARASSLSTSSIQLIHIPASTAVGTYVYDVSFPIGILIQTIGAQPTTTMTGR